MLLWLMAIGFLVGFGCIAIQAWMDNRGGKG